MEKFCLFCEFCPAPQASTTKISLAWLPYPLSSLSGSSGQAWLMARAHVTLFVVVHDLGRFIFHGITQL